MGILSPMLATRDMKKTVEFYDRVLGFKAGTVFPDTTNPEYADFSKDGIIIMFVPANTVKVGRRDKLGAGVNLYLQIDADVDNYYIDLIHKGVKVAAEIKDQQWGSREFTIEDNNGYFLTFSQPSKRAKT